MKYALKLSSDGNVVKIPLPEEKSFKWYSEQIGCEWIEIVRPRGYDYALVVDEEGLLREREFNPYASIMYGFMEHGQPIVGDALLMTEGLVNGEPDLMGLTEEEADKAMNMLFMFKEKAKKFNLGGRK